MILYIALAVLSAVSVVSLYRLYKERQGKKDLSEDKEKLKTTQIEAW